jgi:outer membrane phospholipase A
VFIRSNYLTRLKSHNLDLNLVIYKIFKKEDTNSNIQNHLGFWNFIMGYTDLITFNNRSVDLDFRLFAGSKVIDLDQGAYQLGLIYNFNTKYINPSIYLQHYYGYSEDLLNYNQKKSDLLNLFFLY